MHSRARVHTSHGWQACVTTRDDPSAGSLLATRLSGVVQVLPALSLDADAVLARARLTRAALSGPEDARVPASWEHRLWQAIEAEEGCECFGLRLAAYYMSSGMPSLDGYLARNAPTLRAVLGDMDRFAAITDDRMRMQLTEHGELATIRMARSPERAQGYVECQFACMVGFCHQYIGPIPLFSVHLRRRAPRQLAAYRKAFAGVTPRFGMPHNEMLFPSAALELSVRGAEPALSCILETHAKQLLARIPSTDPLLTRLRAALESELGDGRIELAKVAHKLALSERSLRRQLSERQTGFKQLVDELRCERACKLLTENESVESVAHQVGFRSTSAFQKAFARWMKVAPSEYRRRVQGASVPRA